MQIGRSQSQVESAGGESPALPDDVRQHLGHLLAAAYERACAGPSLIERFADLLARLEAALDDASRHDLAEFQTQLLAATPALRRFAISLTHDRTAADDLVQDVLLRAWRNREKFTLGTNFEAWTFTILRNHFYSDRRKAREVQDEDGAQAARLATIPEQGGHLDLADVQTALSRLAPMMREALVLVTIEDLSYEQAAEVMQCQVGTVKSRVWRAREQLARMLGYGGGDIGSDGFTLSAMVGAA